MPLGYDGFCQPLGVHGVRQTEAASTGAKTVPGEFVAARRVGQHTAEASASRTEVRHSRGGKDAPGIHECHEKIRQFAGRKILLQGFV